MRLVRSLKICYAGSPMNTASTDRECTKKRHVRIIFHLQNAENAAQKRSEKQSGVVLSESDAHLLDILETVYSQQQYMFDNHTHSVENRIVSISQPYIRPIVRGKSKSPVEFGAKQRRRSPIRTIQIELKLSGNSVSQNGNSVLVCCLRKGKIPQKHRLFSA